MPATTTNSIRGRLTNLFRFLPIVPRPWLGRYKRPAGKESAYHAQADGSIQVLWQDVDAGYKFECPVRVTEATRQLAAAVNGIKRHHTGEPGGSFVINEFGQVLCPLQTGTGRFLVGQVRGRLLFEDPWNDATFLSVGDDEGLICGDDWKRPYMGLQYQLAARDLIYYWHESNEAENPPMQDEELINRLRAIRPNGSVRFLVNQHGIILTKQPIGRNRWKAVYVGRINYERWFQQEE